jgi:hypothetical protein
MVWSVTWPGSTRPLHGGVEHGSMFVIAANTAALSTCAGDQQLGDQQLYRMQ